MKPSQGQDNETRPQSQLNSARQKNLEEIKEDVDGENKEGTFPDLKRKLPRDIQEIAESKAA
jgi:DNA polymerase III alpha subunit